MAIPFLLFLNALTVINFTISDWAKLTVTTFRTIPTLLSAQLHTYWPGLAAVWLVTFLFFVFHGIRSLAKGLVSLDKLVANLDRAFSRRLAEVLNGVATATSDPEIGRKAKEHAREVIAGGARFRHLEFANIRLRIVATDIRSSTLQTFSRTETPDIKISDAVGASVAIPVVFKAREIFNMSAYSDGGLVSVLPGWAFENMHNLQPYSWTIAVSLTDPPNPSVGSKWRVRIAALLVHIHAPIRKWFWRQLEPFVGIYRTGVATVHGRTAVDLRPRNRTIHIKIQTLLQPLDFDKLRNVPRIRRARRSAKSYTRLLVSDAVCNQPHGYFKLFEHVVRTLEGLITIKELPKGGVIRVVLAKPFQNKAFLSIVHGRKYFRDDRDASLKHDRIPDDRIDLPAHSTLSGEAYRLAGR